MITTSYKKPKPKQKELEPEPGCPDRCFVCDGDYPNCDPEDCP